MQVHIKSGKPLPPFRSAIAIGINLQYAIGRGIDPEEVLDGTGLRIEQFDDPEVLITPSQGLTIMGRVLDRIDDPQFGLNIASHYNTGVMGKWAIGAMYCATGLDAFRLAFGYFELMPTYFQFELKARGDKAFFILHEPVDLGKCRRFMHESHIRSIYQLCIEIMDGPIALHALHFAFPEPDYADIYPAIFQCPVICDAQTTMAVFDSGLLEKPLPRSNRLTRTLYEKECEQQKQRLSGMQNTSDRVQQELMSRRERFLSIEDVARRLCMCSRTLRRRLNAEGASYKEIAETVRRIKALDLLQTTALSLEQIAEQSGYSDVPNFCRAFRRWTGRTPSSYRVR